MKGAYVKVYVPGTHRSWRTLWRTRPRDRVLFVGTVTGGEMRARLNAPTELRGLTAEDAMASLMTRT